MQLRTADVCFCLRHGLYDTLRRLAEAAEEGHPGDPTTRLWRGVAAGLTGNLSSGIRMLQSLADTTSTVQRCAVAALLHLHRSARVVDSDAIRMFEERDRVLHSNSVVATDESTLSLLLAALEQYHGALDAADRGISIGNGDNALAIGSAALAARGWVRLLRSSRQAISHLLGSENSIYADKDIEADISLAEQDFRSALRGSKAADDEATATYGLALCVRARGAYSEALEILNQLVIMHAGFQGGLIEKALCLAQGSDWSQACDVARRALAGDGNGKAAVACSLVAKLLLAAYSLAHAPPEGSPVAARTGVDVEVRSANSTTSVMSDAGEAIVQLNKCLQEEEPNGSWAYAAATRLALGTGAGRDVESAQVLSQYAVQWGKKAGELGKKTILSDERIVALLAAGWSALQGSHDPAAAARIFADASENTSAGMSALRGAAAAAARMGDKEEAIRQMEFIAAVLDKPIEDDVSRILLGVTSDVAALATGAPAPIATLQRIVLADAESSMSTDVARFLQECDTLVHRATFDGLPLVSVCDPLLAVEAAAALGHLQQAGTLGAREGRAARTRALELLRAIVERFPQIWTARLALARHEYDAEGQGFGYLHDEEDGRNSVPSGGEPPKSGGASRARVALAPVLALRQPPVEALILCAELDLEAGLPADASQRLDDAFASSFEVNRSVRYLSIRARVLSATGAHDDALSAAKAALALPGVRDAARGAGGSSSPPLSTAEQTSAFLAFIEVCIASGRRAEAARVIAEGMQTLEGAPEVAQLRLADARLAVAEGDAARAIALLRAAPAGAPGFAASRLQLANLLLHEYNDHEGYLASFRELAEHMGGSEGTLLMGEALLSVQRPDEAVDAFARALRDDPDNIVLALRVCRALVATHRYHQAREEYRRVLVKVPHDHGVVMEFARFLHRLRQLDDAINVLEQGRTRGATGLASRRQEVERLLLLAHIYGQSHFEEKAIGALQDALAMQEGVLFALRSADGKERAECLAVAAGICADMGAHFERNGDIIRAIENHNDAVKHVPTFARSLGELARLHLSRGDVEQCQANARALLQVDPGNADAVHMLGELLLAQKDFDGAAENYATLLESDPIHFSTLLQLVHAMRRAGRVGDALPFLRAAEKAGAWVAGSPGYAVCRGYYLLYAMRPREALDHFNRARSSKTWRDTALEAMVRIYVSRNAAVASEGMEHAVERGKSRRDAAAAAASAASRSAIALLESVQRTGSLRFTVLMCDALLTSGDRADTESALQRIGEVLQAERDHVPALRVLARGLLQLKQVPKARTTLKRAVKLPYDLAFAYDFEELYLMLADLYVNAGKTELALDLCKRCLAYNKTCARAWELTGVVLEKERAFADASDHYENAWICENEQSPQIGYRLAFNYLKAKRYAEAVDICNKVLAQHPSYPKIKAEVLDKARANLRM